MSLDKKGGYTGGPASAMRPPAQVPSETIRPLCDHHEAVIHNLAQKDNIDDRDSDRVAAQMLRQCCAPRDRSLR